MPHMSRLDQSLLASLALGLLVSVPFVSQAASPLFARFSSDRPTPYAGESFCLTLAIHVSGETLDKQISVNNLPAPTDIQLGNFEELPIETTTLDGLTYEVRKFRTWARATHPGSISLAPLLGGSLIRTTRSNFFMQETRRPVQIPVEPFSIQVRQLPDTGRPPEFSGLVGTYTLTAIATPLDIAPGDLVTLSCSIQGDPLPSTYRMPALKDIPRLKTYEMKLLPNESTPTRHVLQQVLVPEDTRVDAIPPISLVIFNTQIGRYTTLTSGPFPLRYHAERAPIQPAAVPPSASTPAAAVTNAPAPPPTTGFWKRLLARFDGEAAGITTGPAGAQVYLAPSESSESLFVIKSGTHVTVENTHGEWVRIRSGEGIGWVPKGAIKSGK